MAGPEGWFDDTGAPAGWFDETASAEGWFDADLLTTASGGGTQTLSPGLLTNSQTFYGPTIVRGTVTLAPGLLTNSQTFYGATVSQASPQTLAPSLLDASAQILLPAVSQPGAIITGGHGDWAPAPFDWRPPPINRRRMLGTLLAAHIV